MARACFVALVSTLLAGGAAHAAVTVPGGNIINQTWTAANSPYIVQGDITVPVGSTLTIEPGVVMKFEPKTAFMVQLYSTDKPANAVVKAQGTADKPIVFTSASPTPAAGDWRGIWFGGIPQAANVLDHVRIEYAGYDCACALNTCSNIENHEGAVIFSMQPPSAFITNTVFKEIAGHGVTQGFNGTLVNFRPTNTFEGVTGCVQTMPSNPSTECPDPRPACDGM